MPVPFTFNRHGELFKATYLIAGPHLVVTSAYGTRRAVLGIMKPVKLAKALLAAMIRHAETASLPVATLSGPVAETYAR